LAVKWFGDIAEARRACAIRELYEEAGLLLTASGLIQTQRTIPVQEVSFESPEPAALHEVARWVAPEFLAVRFDAWFFAVEAPGGLEPSPDGTEIERAWWASSDEVLSASTRGDAPLMWPTLVSLERLAECDSVEDVLAIRIEQIQPPAPGEQPGWLRGAWERPEESRARPTQGR
jgi:8-oxo-dGTP pyrophosphatase MutT (NUDIX family)